MNEKSPPPALPGRSRRHAPFIAAGLLVLVTVLAYANSFAVPFAFDDKPAVLDNPTLHRLWPLTDPLSPPAAGSGVTGRPLVNLSLAFNYAMSGEAVWSYHATNLLIHLGAGLALFGLVRRTLLQPSLPPRLRDNALPAALLVAALWLVHPLQTESVTSVIQRTESLMGLFYLLTLYGFIRGAQGPRTGLWLGLSWTCCLMGMASKEVMVSAPLIVLLYDRTFIAGTFRAAWRLRRGYYLGLGGTWLLLAWLVAGGSGTRGEAAGFGLGVTPWHYLLTQCQAIVMYLKLSFWPHPLIFDYGTVIVDRVASVWLQGLVLLALAGATVVALWRRPAVGFLGACFFALLAPSSSIVPLVSQTMAEHRMYLPLGAVLGGTVIAAVWYAGRHIVLGLGAVVVLAFMALTFQRNRDYRSETALWADTVEKFPANARARVNLAEIFINTGQPAAALEQAAEAVRLRPGYPEAQTNLGIALAQTGRTSEALGPCSAAIELNPRYARGHSNLGVVLAQLGRMEEAITHFEQALRLAPGSPDAVALRTNLGNALLQAHRFPEAVGHYEEVLKARPESVDVHYRLGVALALSDRFQEAGRHFEAALKLDPGHEGARGALEALRAAR